METPKFTTKDLTDAAVDVVDEFRVEGDTEDGTRTEQEVAIASLVRYADLTDEVNFNNRINAIH